MHEVANHIGSSIGEDCEWMGVHTFGEQGPAKTVHRDTTLPASQQGAQPSVHGNLMFNCLLFGEREVTQDAQNPIGGDVTRFKMTV
jgi:hypothetical protein